STAITAVRHVARASGVPSAGNGSGWVTFMPNIAQPLTQFLSGDLAAFLRAGFARVTASLAYGNLGELIAFFLAIVADHLDHLGKMTSMLGIDRCQSCKRLASSNELERRIGAVRHARVLHLIHAKAMPEAVIACPHALQSFGLEGLVFRRMHFLL